MSDAPSGYPDFRRRLDSVLRQRDPAALRVFLIAEGQWGEETTTDPEAAMWMMIATSPALASDHADAHQWLMTHGHEAEAQAIFGASRSQGKPQARGAQPRHRGASGPGGRDGGGKPKPQGGAPKPGKRDGKRPRS
jgi:hypothetical protein